MIGLKNLAMLPSYFDYIFVHLKQKARLRPVFNSEIFVNFRTRPEKPGPNYNSGSSGFDNRQNFYKPNLSPRKNALFS